MKPDRDESPHRPARRGIPRPPRGRARRVGLAPGDQGAGVRGDGGAPASRDGRRAGGARDDRRSQRRAARDRTARDDDLREPAAGRRCAGPHARGRQAPRSRSRRALSDAHRPLARLRVRRAEGGSAQGREAREARLRGPRLLSGGAPLLPAGPGRGADPRLRGPRQQGPRGSRALARRHARRQAGEPDDRQGSVRPRARRGRDEAGDAGQGRPAHDRPSDPGRTRRRSSPRRFGAGRRSRPRLS